MIQENNNKPQAGTAISSTSHTEVFFLVTWGYHLKTQQQLCHPDKRGCNYCIETAEKQLPREGISSKSPILFILSSLSPNCQHFIKRSFLHYKTAGQQAAQNWKGSKKASFKRHSIRQHKTLEIYLQTQISIRETEDSRTMIWRLL